MRKEAGEVGRVFCARGAVVADVVTGKIFVVDVGPVWGVSERFVRG